MATKLLLLLAIYRLIVIVGLTLDHPTDLIQTEIQLSFTLEDIYEASHDFGNMITTKPSGVLHPSSTHDVAKLVKLAYESPHGFPVSARGHGHSINGQAQTGIGVVVQMSGSRGWTPRPVVNEELMYVDVWGGELWIDVLNSTLMNGLAPRSWTDYLYLSVGGTLSNAGISGQAFNHGPQISNVHEIDVVTGT